MSVSIMLLFLVVVIAGFSLAMATANILSIIPAAMQLRHLQTLTEIGVERSATVIFPMPMDVIKPFPELFDKVGKPATPVPATAPITLRSRPLPARAREEMPRRPLRTAVA